MKHKSRRVAGGKKGQQLQKCKTLNTVLDTCRGLRENDSIDTNTALKKEESEAMLNPGLLS